MSGLEQLLTGRTLVKRYRIQEVIGRGGFAAVYRADDERLGRPVAVKVITIAAQDPASAERHRERFEREARAAASLPQHPNVVTVHDFGIDPATGLDFLVMEFLHGEDLATRLRKQGRLPLDEGLRILREASSGIAVGHRAGIVHRDVKPGNIFLAQSRDGDPERVCILDFGIAQVLADDHTLTRLPGEGTPLSPAYASPEQSRGAREITSASDVFSLGVVGYQLLTGEKPFPAQRGADPADWVPARRIRDLNPDVPAAVEAVIGRALAYAPEDRFADADDFTSALASAALEDDATVAYPPAAAAAAGSWEAAGGVEERDETLFQPPLQRPIASEREPVVLASPPPPRRRRGGMALLLVLLIAGGLGAGWWVLNRPRPVPPADQGAVEDVEVISEGLDASREEPREAQPTNGGESDVESGPTTTPGFPPDGQPGDLVPPSPLPGDTQAADTLPPGTGTAPTPDPAATPTPADTGRTPPRVIGVPVDSARSPPQSAGNRSTEPPPASVVPIAA